MKQLLSLFVLAGIGGFLWVSSAQAISLDFVPANQMATSGSSVSVDIVIFGLEAGGLDEVVSGFDLDVTYDSTIIQATGVAFGGFLDTGLGFLPSLQSSNVSAFGVVDLAELSFDTDPDLALFQPDTFTLASLSFNTIGVGTSPLAFIFDPVNNVTGHNAAILDLMSSTGSVTVKSQSGVIPEPSTIVLLGTGLAGLGLWRWKNILRK